MPQKGKKSLGSGVYKRTEKHRKILSEAQKKIGNKPPSAVGNKYNLGRKPSKETREKMRNSHLGEKSHLWKGGVSTLYELIRTCYKYRQWRSDVYTRDNFICVTCNKRGYKLNADHIKSFSEIIREFDIKSLDEALDCEELWNINNGRTLCLDCHKKTDTYLNKGRWGRK